MSLLCWNCCRLGNPQTKQELRDLIRVQVPLVVFLTETWVDKARLEEILVRYRFWGGGLIEVSREREEEEVWLFFGELIVIFFMDTYSLNHINAIVNKRKDDEWRFTSFYGEPGTNIRHESWAKL